MEPSDNELMTAAGTGVVSNLSVLFERHHRALFRYFVSMTRQTEVAEDLVQEVFFRILRFRGTYDSRQSFRAWMYQIARNLYFDRVRQRRGEVVGIDDYLSGPGELSSGEPDPEVRTLRAEELVLLRQALDQLPPEKREILVLSRFQGMKYEEIADVLGCEIATVKSRIFRAIRALENAYYTLAGEKAS